MGDKDDFVFGVGGQSGLDRFDEEGVKFLSVGFAIGIGGIVSVELAFSPDSQRLPIAIHEVG
jgi:hypothetical protein